MKELKHRFYGLYFLMVAGFILLLYFLLSNIVQNRIVSQQQEQLTEEIVTLVDYVEKHNQSNDLTESEVVASLSEVAPVIRERITFIDPEGNPLFDSTISLNELENLFNRKEIQQVLVGKKIGTATQDKDMNKEQYYVAQAIFNQKEEPVGILRLSSEISNLTETIVHSLRLQLLGMVIFAVIIVLWATKWINKMIEALAGMKQVVRKLTRFDYEARYTGQSYEEIDDLGSSINELAGNLEKQEIELYTSEETTYGLINHLIIGVMLLDENRHMQIVNPIMNELLGTNLYGNITQLYTDYIRSAELIELIEQAYNKNEAVNAEIKLYLPEEKTLDANVVPVPSRIPGESNYIVLLYDITEIQRLENIRTDFATNVSHELRTPITALKGFSETLLDGAMHDEEVLTEFLEIMLIESTRLDSMVQDILHLSKLERGRTRTSIEWIEVHDVVEEVFQILQQKIELKNMTCYIEEGQSISIRANKDYLKQILMNLIANAISYTPENGTVLVDLDQVGEEIRIQIIDNGIGIPEADQLRIFERFYRVDKARSRNSGGTGLGLAIVKWVVDSMNGRMELFSEENVGTTFVIWLPIDKNPDNLNKIES